MISLIVAMAKNHVIGIKNDLPWHIPADLKRFKDLTRGKPCIMGRNTFESIVARIGKPLPERPNIVITRGNFTHEGAIIQSSLDDAISFARREYPHQDIMIIGGASVYEQAISKVDRMYLTVVDMTPEGDAFFPPVNDAEWNITAKEELNDPVPYTNYVLDRSC